MDKAPVIEHVALIADDETLGIAEPIEEPLDLPAVAIAPEWASILRFGPDTSATMRRKHLDPQGRQGRIQRISVIGTISNQADRQLVYKAGVESWGDERDRVRRS